MQLEQTLGMYQPMAPQERQTTYFVVGNLESLSASALYTGEPCGKISAPRVGMTLSEGLTIKKVD